MQHMAHSGTATFANPHEYSAAVRAASLNLIVTGGGDFNARLTWLNLDHLFLLRGREICRALDFFRCRRSERLFRFQPTQGQP
jgi:hypothetical protein